MALNLPKDDSFLTVEDVVKMLYLASGWVESALKDKSLARQLESAALKVHDHPEHGVTSNVGHQELVAELTRMGIAVNNGMVKKSDVAAALKAVAASEVDINKMIDELPEAWEEYRSSNDWGSGEDQIKITDKIEKEWYEQQCDKAGLTDAEIDRVLDGLGF